MKRVHGDIRPIYVSLTSEGVPILSDRLADPRDSLRINYTHFKKRRDVYMCPYLFEKFCNKSNDIDIELKKFDVFSIGLVILETGLLHSI